MTRAEKMVALMLKPSTFAYRGYLISKRTDVGYAITKDRHVIQHQTPSIDDAKAIIDALCV